MASQSLAVGVDIGGTGIKAGIVDLQKGELRSDRIKVATPSGAEPPDVLVAVKEVLSTLEVDSDGGRSLLLTSTSPYAVEALALEEIKGRRR